MRSRGCSISSCVFFGQSMSPKGLARRKKAVHRQGRREHNQRQSQKGDQSARASGPEEAALVDDLGEIATKHRTRVRFTASRSSTAEDESVVSRVPETAPYWPGRR